MRGYKINTYANGFGVWHAEILFTEPMGNTGEARRVIYKAIENAKRRIRREITERMAPKKTRRLSYQISENNELPTGQLTRLVVREK
jgi:ribosome-binding factor A